MAAIGDAAGFSPRAGIRGFDTAATLHQACATSTAMQRFSPRAGIRGFDTSHDGASVRADVANRAGFSPRAGIRGFDTDAGSVHARGTHGRSVRCFSPRAGIRGFDTLIGQTRSSAGLTSDRCFSPRAGIRGFDTTALVDVCDYVASSYRFSPRAGIRGFDTLRFPPQTVRKGGLADFWACCKAFSGAHPAFFLAISA